MNDSELIFSAFVAFLLFILACLWITKYEIDHGNRGCEHDDTDGDGDRWRWQSSTTYTDAPCEHDDTDDEDETE